MEGRGVLAATLWIAVWWITEAIPISATALLPIVLFPVSGALGMNTTTAAYASPMIFLFMGGFMIAAAIEKWNLHQRIALTIISKTGAGLNQIILGFMLACGFLSMWISNTATAVMMLPIGLAVAKQLGSGIKNEATTERKIGQVMMLGIAYSCSVGGIATLIGTPTNVIFSAVIQKMYGIEITFSKWMSFGLPISVGLLLIAWLYLTRFAYSSLKITNIEGSKREIRNQLIELGEISEEEKKVLLIFIGVAIAWICRSFLLQKMIPGINDAVIAIAGALLLFIIPTKADKRDFLLDWRTAQKIPWGILLLFGGGLAIAAGFKESGLAMWIGNQISLLAAVPYIMLLLILITIVNFLTEITSNVATASILLPIIAALSVSIGVHPYGLMIAVTVAASCAFMLPVATPPNAVVFSSGYLSIPRMVQVGIWMNIWSILLLTVFVYFVLPWLWGIDLEGLPAEFLNTTLE